MPRGFVCREVPVRRLEAFFSPQQMPFPSGSTTLEPRQTVVAMISVTRLQHPIETRESLVRRDVFWLKRSVEMQTELSIRDAAQQLSVSPSTFKRLCEKHGVELNRTPGGHRRVPLNALDELACKLGIGELQRQTRHSWRGSLSTNNVLDLLKTQQSDQLRDRILAACRQPSDLISIIDQAIAPALWTMGTMWQRGEMKVYETQICTETMLRSIYALETHFQRVQETGLQAVGGCLHEGCDTMSSKLVALSLLSLGVRAHDLGPRVPAEEMADAANALAADLVWCSSTHWDDRADLIGQHLLLRRMLAVETPLMIGGGGLSKSAVHSLEACTYFETLGGMAAFVQDMVAKKKVDKETGSTGSLRSRSPQSL